MTDRRVLVVEVSRGESLEIEAPVGASGKITVKLLQKTGSRARLMVMAREDVKINHLGEPAAFKPRASG